MQGAAARADAIRAERQGAQPALPAVSLQGLPQRDEPPWVVSARAAALAAAAASSAAAATAPSDAVLRSGDAASAARCGRAPAVSASAVPPPWEPERVPEPAPLQPQPVRPARERAAPAAVRTLRLAVPARPLQVRAESRPAAAVPAPLQVPRPRPRAPAQASPS